MGNKLSTIVALTTALTPALASAIGFGEITLISRIGQPLMAEIPIVSSSGDTPIASCFSMVALRGSDFPVVANAKPRLIRRGGGYILQLAGYQPVNEPVFAIGVRANCGYDIEREYVLMPEAPFELARSQGTAPVAETPPAKPRKTSRWLAREGQTLQDIANAQNPASPAEQQRLLAALKRANPDLEADTPLPEGMPIQVPSQPRAKPPARERTSSQPASSPSANMGEMQPAKVSAASRKPKPEAPSAPTGADRLVLGTAEEAPPAARKGNSPLSQSETEERILRLETTLHSLTEEMAKMDQALALATKAIETQNQLQQAQSAQAAAPRPTVEAAGPASHPASSNWLELLLSALLGAGISVGMAQYLGRRRRYPGEDEVPLAFAGYRNEASPKATAQAQVAEPTAPEAQPVRSAPEATTEPEITFSAPSLTEVDIPLQPELIETKTEEEHSVLELAEIMLSFGRLRGAAETLAEHIDTNMPQSIEPWSMLLDLYRRGGMRDEFEALSAKMRNRFNARIPDWSESQTPISGLKALEDYPHVIQKASHLWGTQSGLDYLYSLVHDTRAGQRNGFPLEVVEEIALLMRILADGYQLQRPH